MKWHGDLRYFVCFHYILMEKTKAQKRKYYYISLLVFVAVVLVYNILIINIIGLDLSKCCHEMI